MSRRRRAGTLSQLLAFLYASFANLTLGGRHTPLEPLTNERPTPVMSKHWPLQALRVTVAAAVVAIAALTVFAFGPTTEAVAKSMW